MNEPTQLMSPADMQSLAESAAKSGMFGLQNPSQAICLMALCQAEGINPVLALRRYHIIEGKPSMRADAMLAEFQARGGGVIWHVRNDTECAATFFLDAKKIDEKAQQRAHTRYSRLADKKEADQLSEYGEETIIRTIEDAKAKRTCMSWDKEKKEWKMKFVWQANPRQMLTARVITEGVRLIAPGVVAGIYAPEELEDSREAFLQDAGQAPDRDLGAMQAILAQHEQNALDATNEHDRKRFQVLASEMRVLISEKGGDEKCAAPVTTDRSRQTSVSVPSTQQPSNPAPTSHPESADDIPMKHAADLPKDLKLVKGSEVPQPKNKEGTAVPPTEEKKPESQQASAPAEEPYPTDWREYKIRFVPAYAGRPLGALSAAEMTVLLKSKTVARLAASKDWKESTEAKFIKQGGGK